MKPTTEQISKLPAWARGHIQTIGRERDAAIRALNDHLNNEKPSPFYVEDMLSTGERGSGPSIKRRNFQTYGKMFVEHAGVRLAIYLRREDAIEMQWDAPNRGLDEIALIPSSFQQVRLVARSNMR